jgi:hypothetical protein
VFARLPHNSETLNLMNSQMAQTDNIHQSSGHFGVARLSCNLCWSLSLGKSQTLNPMNLEMARKDNIRKSSMNPQQGSMDPWMEIPWNFFILLQGPLPHGSMNSQMVGNPCSRLCSSLCLLTFRIVVSRFRFGLFPEAMFGVVGSTEVCWSLEGFPRDP